MIHSERSSQSSHAATVLGSISCKLEEGGHPLVDPDKSVLYESGRMFKSDVSDQKWYTCNRLLETTTHCIQFSGLFNGYDGNLFRSALWPHVQSHLTWVVIARSAQRVLRHSSSANGAAPSTRRQEVIKFVIRPHERRQFAGPNQVHLRPRDLG